MDIDYAPSLPPAVVADLEHAARTVGLPLAELELLGQDLVMALRFIDVVHAGPTEAFLDGVDWDRLERIHQLRSRWSERPVKVL